MRKPLALVASIALAGSLAVAHPDVSAGATAAAAKPKHPKALSSKPLTDAVTVRGILTHERALQGIANRNGGNRASGQPGYNASANYVASTMSKAGYRVRRQGFSFPSFRELEPATLTRTAPSEQEIETVVMTYSGSGDVTGPVVPIDVTLPAPAEPGSTSGCEASDFPAPGSDDAIALIQRGTCTFDVKAANAAAAGYAAAVIFNEGQEGRQETLAGTLSAPTDIPVVGISYDAGRDLAADGTRARVTTSTETDLDARTSNVIVDLPTRVKPKKPGEVVVIGAHLDSVEEGPGINDNGSGTATVMEIARQMAKIRKDHRLYRSVRFVFYGAEESGLLGSTHYVETLSQRERSKIYANLNFDMLGSPNYARLVYDGDGSDGVAGPPGSGAIEQIFTRYFAGKGLASEPTAFDGRSDYGPYIETGIPAGGLFSGAEEIKTEAQAVRYGGTAGEAFDSCYHQACDDITNLNTQALLELGDAAAHGAYVLTSTSKGLYPDGSRTAARRSAAPSSSAPERAGHTLAR